MIILHTVNSDERSNELEKRLNELVIAFQKVEHEQGEIKHGYIEEDGQDYKSSEEIERWFDELSGDLEWQRSISGDGCYIDPESGNVC